MTLKVSGKSLVCLALLAGSLSIGMKWQQFLYLDKCLDMGGGMNPGNRAVCIVEKTIDKQEVAFSADTQSRQLIGPWLMEGENWGFTLYEDGNASSINSATLVYQHWFLDKGEICMTSRSVGNHSQSTSTECSAYEITGNGNEVRLLIGNGDYKTIYRRP